MIKETLEFLRLLQRNNNRDWFQENKEQYDVLRVQFAKDVQLLIQHIALFDQEVAGMEAKDCLYRIYRDIRFSPDKTPYKTYFSAYIARGGRKSERAGYYIHIEPDNMLLSGGVWCPQPRLLKMLRTAVYDHVEEFTEIIDNPLFRESYPELEGETLQKVPQPFPKDFVRADLLKRKDYVVLGKKAESFFTQNSWIEASASEFEKLLPFNRFLNYTVDEFLGNVD